MPPATYAAAARPSVQQQQQQQHQERGPARGPAGGGPSRTQGRRAPYSAPTPVLFRLPSELAGQFQRAPLADQKLTFTLFAPVVHAVVPVRTLCEAFHAGLTKALTKHAPGGSSESTPAIPHIPMPDCHFWRAQQQRGQPAAWGLYTFRFALPAEEAAALRTTLLSKDHLGMVQMEVEGHGPCAAQLHASNLPGPSGATFLVRLDFDRVIGPELAVAFLSHIKAFEQVHWVHHVGDLPSLPPATAGGTSRHSLFALVNGGARMLRARKAKICLSSVGGAYAEVTFEKVHLILKPPLHADQPQHTTSPTPHGAADPPLNSAPTTTPKKKRSREHDGSPHRPSAPHNAAANDLAVPCSAPRPFPPPLVPTGPSPRGASASTPLPAPTAPVKSTAATLPPSTTSPCPPTTAEPPSNAALPTAYAAPIANANSPLANDATIGNDAPMVDIADTTAPPAPLVAAPIYDAAPTPNASPTTAAPTGMAAPTTNATNSGNAAPMADDALMADGADVTAPPEPQAAPSTNSTHPPSAAVESMDTHAQ